MQREKVHLSLRSFRLGVSDLWGSITSLKTKKQDETGHLMAEM